MRPLFSLALLALGLAGCQRATVRPQAATWQPVPYASPALGGFSEVQFASAQVGWVIGGYDLSGARYSALLTTRDGGSTWTSQNLYPLTLNGFRSLAPVSEQVAFALGVDPIASQPGVPANAADGRAVYKTTNGGTTWQQLLNTGFMGSFHLHFFTENTGLSLKNQRIQRTTDGGNSWQTVLDGSGGGDWNLVQFPGGNTGYAAGGNLSGGIAGGYISKGALARTTDQGATWQVLPWAYGFINSLSFVSASVGFATTAPDYHLYKTQDGGSTWTLVNSALPATSTGKFLNEREGYLTEGARIYYTADGGATWQPSYQVPAISQYPAAINGLTFSSAGTGFAVTADGQIIKGTR